MSFNLIHILNEQLKLHLNNFSIMFSFTDNSYSIGIDRILILKKEFKSQKDISLFELNNILEKSEGDKTSTIINDLKNENLNQEKITPQELENQQSHSSENDFLFLYNTNRYFVDKGDLNSKTIISYNNSSNSLTVNLLQIKVFWNDTWINKQKEQILELIGDLKSLSLKFINVLNVNSKEISNLVDKNSKNNTNDKISSIILNINSLFVINNDNNLFQNGIRITNIYNYIDLNDQINLNSVFLQFYSQKLKIIDFTNYPFTRSKIELQDLYNLNESVFIKTNIENNINKELIQNQQINKFIDNYTFLLKVELKNDIYQKSFPDKETTVVKIIIRNLDVTLMLQPIFRFIDFINVKLLPNIIRSNDVNKSNVEDINIKPKLKYVLDIYDTTINLKPNLNFKDFIQLKISKLNIENVYINDIGRHCNLKPISEEIKIQTDKIFMSSSYLKSHEKMSDSILILYNRIINQDLLKYYLFNFKEIDFSNKIDIQCKSLKLSLSKNVFTILLSSIFNLIIYKDEKDKYFNENSQPGNDLFMKMNIENFKLLFKDKSVVEQNHFNFLEIDLNSLSMIYKNSSVVGSNINLTINTIDIVKNELNEENQIILNSNKKIIFIVMSILMQGSEMKIDIDISPIIINEKVLIFKHLYNIIKMEKEFYLNSLIMPQRLSKKYKMTVRLNIEQISLELFKKVKEGNFILVVLERLHLEYISEKNNIKSEIINISRIKNNLDSKLIQFINLIDLKRFVLNINQIFLIINTVSVYGVINQKSIKIVKLFLNFGKEYFWSENNLKDYYIKTKINLNVSPINIPLYIINIFQETKSLISKMEYNISINDLALKYLKQVISSDNILNVTNYNKYNKDAKFDYYQTQDIIFESPITINIYAEVFGKKGLLVTAQITVDSFNSISITKSCSNMDVRCSIKLDYNNLSINKLEPVFEYMNFDLAKHSKDLLSSTYSLNLTNNLTSVNVSDEFINILFAIKSQLESGYSSVFFDLDRIEDSVIISISNETGWTLLLENNSLFKNQTMIIDKKNDVKIKIDKNSQINNQLYSMYILFEEENKKLDNSLISTGSNLLKSPIDLGISKSNVKNNNETLELNFINKKDKYNKGTNLFLNQASIVDTLEKLNFPFLNIEKSFVENILVYTFRTSTCFKNFSGTNVKINFVKNNINKLISINHDEFIYVPLGFELGQFSIIIENIKESIQGILLPISYITLKQYKNLNEKNTSDNTIDFSFEYLLKNKCLIILVQLINTNLFISIHSSIEYINATLSEVRISDPNYIEQLLVLKPSGCKRYNYKTIKDEHVVNIQVDNFELINFKITQKELTNCPLTKKLELIDKSQEECRLKVYLYISNTNNIKLIFYFPSVLRDESEDLFWFYQTKKDIIQRCYSISDTNCNLNQYVINLKKEIHLSNYLNNTDKLIPIILKDRKYIEVPVVTNDLTKIYVIVTEDKKVHDEIFIFYKVLRLFPKYILSNLTTHFLILKYSILEYTKQLESNEVISIFGSKENKSLFYKLSTAKTLDSCLINFTKKGVFHFMMESKNKTPIFFKLENSNVVDFKYYSLVSESKFGQFQISNFTTKFNIQVHQLNCKNSSYHCNISINETSYYSWNDSFANNKKLEIVFQVVGSSELNHKLYLSLEDFKSESLINIFGYYLRVIISSEENLFQIIFKSSDSKSEKQIMSSSYKVSIKNIVFSLISKHNKNRGEFVAIHLNQLNLECSNILETEVNLSINDIQLDFNSDIMTKYPVIFKSKNRNNENNDKSVDINFRFFNKNGKIIFESIFIHLTQCSVSFDENFILNVLNYIKHLQNQRQITEKIYGLCNAVSSTDSDSGRWKSLVVKFRPFIYIDNLQVSKIDIMFSFKKNKSIERIFELSGLPSNIIHSILVILANIDNLPINLPEMSYRNDLKSISKLSKYIYDCYKKEILFLGIKLLGSANILGNPLNIYKNISEGVSHIFSIFDSSNHKSLLENSNVLLSKIMYGTSDSVNRITGGISEGLTVLISDADYLKNRDLILKNNGNKILNGLKNLGYGIVDGLTGVILKPQQGFDQNGMEGLLKGAYLGLSGMVLKPITGIFDLASMTSNQIMSSFEDKKLLVNNQRKRNPRPFYGNDQTYKIYNEDDTFPTMTLEIFENLHLILILDISSGMEKLFIFFEGIIILDSDKEVLNLLVQNILGCTESRHTISIEYFTIKSNVVELNAYVIDVDVAKDALKIKNAIKLMLDSYNNLNYF